MLYNVHCAAWQRSTVFPYIRSVRAHGLVASSGRHRSTHLRVTKLYRKKSATSYAVPPLCVGYEARLVTPSRSPCRARRTPGETTGRRTSRLVPVSPSNSRLGTAYDRKPCARRFPARVSSALASRVRGRPASVVDSVDGAGGVRTRRARARARRSIVLHAHCSTPIILRSIYTGTRARPPALVCYILIITITYCLSSSSI